MNILLAGDPDQPVTLLPCRWSQWYASRGASGTTAYPGAQPLGGGVRVVPRPISAMTCKPGALGAAFAIPRSATTDRKSPLRRWPRSCATGIALEASQRPVSSFRVFILGDPWHTICSAAYTTRSPSATDLRAPRPYRKPTTGQRAFGSGKRCGEHRLPGEFVVARLSLPGWARV